MTATTFSSTSGGSGFDFDIDVVVSGITGTATQIDVEATFSSFGHSGMSCDVVDPDGTSHVLFGSGTVSGSGSTTQTATFSFVPTTVNGTYTFEFFDFSGFANPIVNAGDCKVTVTTGSSGSNYTATGESVDSASQAESPDATADYTATGGSVDSASQAESPNVTAHTPSVYQLEVDDVDCVSEAESFEVSLFGFSQAINGVYAWYCATLDQDVSSGVSDLSGNGRDMAISGTLPVVSDSGVGGTHAYDDTDSVEAIYDINGYFSHSDSLHGGFTCSYWVKFDSDAGDAWPVGFQGDSSPPSSSYSGLSAGFVRDDSGVSTVFRAALAGWNDNDASIDADFTQTGSISSGVWNHILITGGSAQYLYVNGVYQGGATGLWGYSASQHDKLWLGCDGDSRIDDVRYWDRELSSSEVIALYSGGRAWGAVPVSLEVDSVSSSSECFSVEVTTQDFLLVESVESLPRIHIQQICVNQMVGLSSSEEVFWYYPEFNAPNGLDLSPNYNLRNHVGGVLGNLSNANMWGTIDIIQQSRYLYGNPYWNSGRQYVDLQRKFFDQTSGDFSVSYRFGIPDFNSMDDADEFWLYGCGTDLNPNFGTTSANGFKVWISPYPARNIHVSLTFRNQEFGSNGRPEYYQKTFATSLQVNEGAFNHLVISLDAHQSLIVTLNGVSASSSIQFSDAGLSAFLPHMPDDWYLGAVNDDLSKKDFFGTFGDFRGYDKVLSSSEISELALGGKGTQAVCDAGDPNAATELLVLNAQSASHVSDFELRPFEIVPSSVQCGSHVEDFYVLPIDLGDVASVVSATEVSEFSLNGSVQLEVLSVDSLSLARSIFTVEATVGLTADSCDSQSESQTVLVPAVNKVIFVNSSDATGEAEEVYMPLSPNQKLATARNVQCQPECSRPNVNETGASDAYLIYCPSRSYDYVDTGYLPDLSGNHSPTSVNNPDILWEKIEQEWAIDMRSTSPFASNISNAVEIVPDPSESINNFAAPASSPDGSFSISMHFMYDEWPEQYGSNIGNKNTCMGLYNFVVLESAEGQSPIDYFEGVSAGVRVFAVRRYSKDLVVINCQLLKKNSAQWARRYSTALDTTYKFQPNKVHHLVVTYDGDSYNGIRIVLNNQDVTGATTGVISPSTPYSKSNAYSEFTHPTPLRKAFIGRTNGIYAYQATSYEGLNHTHETRGEAVPYWDDFRYFQEELNDTQIHRLLTRGVDLPARFELEVDNAGSALECETFFAPVTYSPAPIDLDSAAEVDEIFTVGFNYLIDADDNRSFTRVESFSIVRHKGTPAASTDSNSEASSPDVRVGRHLSAISLLSASQVSRPSASKNISLIPKSVERSVEVFAPSLSGDGEVFVDSTQSPSESQRVDVSRNLYLSPASVDSQGVCGELASDVGFGLLASGSDSPSECDGLDEQEIGLRASLSVRSIESSAEVDSVFFFTDKTLFIGSVEVPTECESPPAYIGTSLSSPEPTESASETEGFNLVIASSLDIDSCDSISEVSDATLAFVLGIDAEDVDSGSESESPYVSMSPLRASSVECAAEVKGFTLPDLSKTKKGPPRLFLESDLIIGDY